MRFRRSTGATSRAGVAYTGASPQGMRRRRLLRIGLTITIIAVGVLAIAFTSDSWVSGDGIVVGDLGSIAPVVQGRITKLNKQCLDYVSRGEVVAIIQDETAAATATQELRQFEIDASQAHADEEIAKTDAEAARSYVQSLDSLTAQLAQVFKAETALLQRKYVSTLDWEQAKAALDQAQANENAAQYLMQSKLGDGQKAKLAGSLIDARITAFKNTPALWGEYDLVAPKSGYLIECSASVGSVVNVGTSLFSIYDPNDAYIVSFLSPTAAARLHVGDKLSVYASGLDDKLSGTIVGFYPEQSALPDSLTRYFWQDQKWSQYVPVKVTLTDLTPRQQQAVYSSAEASVSAWTPPRTGFFGMISRVIGMNPS